MKKLFLCQKAIYLALLCTTANIFTMIVIPKLPQNLYCDSSCSNVSNYFNTKLVNEIALRTAAESNNETELSRLINLKVNINATGPQGDTPLHFAVYNKHVNAVKILITNGALVNTQNLNGLTPLHSTTISLLKQKENKPFVELIELLLQHGAQITIKDSRGYRPDNDLTAQSETATPPNEIDNQIYIKLSSQCIAPNKKYRLKVIADTSPANLSAEEIKQQERIAANRAHALLLCSRLEKEINKEKRLNINRVHALFLYERLQHPESSRRQGTNAPLYLQETPITSYSFWCPYSNKLLYISK